LGILDKATLTLGDNRRVDFSRSMIFLTSNLGAKEMSELISGSIGFAPARSRTLAEDDLDQKIYRTALEAAKRKFSPEFMNRIDKVVVFRSLTRPQLEQILELELGALQRRILAGLGPHFTFTLTEEAKRLLLEEGTNYQYGARHLKRAIERLIVYPISALVATGQIRTGDLVRIGLDDQQKLTFERDQSLAGAAQAAIEIAQILKSGSKHTRVAA
jgi:ATP-dependent Clp protease ATP-binding subunit ClpB